MIPLSNGSRGGAYLLDDVSKYPNDYRTDIHVYTGTSGGFDLTSLGVMRQHSPMVPQALTPSETHIVSTFEMSYRPINDLGGKYEINLSSIFPTTSINTDGTLDGNNIDKKQMEMQLQV